MTGKITKRDLATIERLVDKYGAAAVAKAAKAKPAGTPGRPADLEANAVAVWAWVELRRSKPGRTRKAGVLETCNKLSGLLKKWTVGRSLSTDRLRGMYYAAKVLRKNNENSRRVSDDTLASWRKFPIETQARIIPLFLHRTADGQLETVVVDTRGQSYCPKRTTTDS